MTAEPEKRAMALSAVDRPVFVIGTMRSGTGFLGLQLNGCANLVGCPFELRGIWSRVGNVPMAWDSVGGDCPGLDASDIARVATDELRHAFAGEVEKNIGSKHWSFELRFLNKNPHLCNKIDLVDRLFPRAAFIWTIRNLDDVVCSLKNLFERDNMRRRGVRHLWPATPCGAKARCFRVNHDALRHPVRDEHAFPGGNIVYLAEYWLESNLAMLRFYRQHGSKRMFVVPQAALFSRPEKVGSGLRGFLQLEPGALRSLPDAVDSTSVGRWKTRLDGDELRLLEEFRERHADAIGRIHHAVTAGYD